MAKIITTISIRKKWPRITNGLRTINDFFRFLCANIALLSTLLYEEEFFKSFSDLPFFTSDTTITLNKF
ncbi:hypothetical protein GCM10023260_00760 [Bartonella acomydis]|uniref:Uncharacterized protein n=1 Tax=Bartonella acomydis TaxID=686234 RepID=A0ABP9MAX4_9HYPH